LTLKMALAAVLETSVPNNSPSQDSDHPDYIFQSRYDLLLGSNHFLIMMMNAVVIIVMTS